MFHRFHQFLSVLLLVPRRKTKVSTKSVWIPAKKARPQIHYILYLSVKTRGVTHCPVTRYSVFPITSYKHMG
ncbi:hypothetical protein F4820DRAFT_432584 [Hypoxylon rubiginosum]|uniref:Uncharacterized protein n=1 Tax=Hypoxylon rubiginosum TaxID=110542 RepID=A0ACB9YQW4_9PEZI|nr:hypothetical protein F4820DRAFT_432584 [Hypoxylon rubiginosum]